MIGHLSQENNFPELAFKSVLEQIDLHKNLHLEVATRLGPGRFFEVN